MSSYRHVIVWVTSCEKEKKSLGTRLVPDWCHQSLHPDHFIMKSLCQCTPYHSSFISLTSFFNQFIPVTLIHPSHFMCNHVTSNCLCTFRLKALVQFEQFEAWQKFKYIMCLPPLNALMDQKSYPWAIQMDSKDGGFAYI